MQKVKRSFMLMEVLIALFLIGIIMTALLQVYKNLSLQNVKADEAVEQILKQHTCSARLQKIFNGLEKSEKISLYTQGLKLFLRWDNGVNINPKLSGPLEGELCLKGKNLTLSCYRDKEKISEEIFLEGVEDLEFSFYDIETDWVPTWSPEKGVEPPMIKIRLFFDKEKKKGWEIPFFLHQSEHEIFYEKKV